METTKITYMRRFNLGNYQHEEFTIEIALAPSDMPSDAIKYASSMIELCTAQSKEQREVLEANIQKEHRAVIKKGVNSNEYF